MLALARSAVFTVPAAMSGMKREYQRTRTLEGHESARKRGKAIGLTDDPMLSMALHLREQEMSVRDIAKRRVVTSGAKKGRRPSPAVVIWGCCRGCRRCGSGSARLLGVQPR